MPVMFDTPGPRVFGLPPGVDFPDALIAGLKARLVNEPPEAMARVTVYVNTARMMRSISDKLTAQGARFLPRLRLVTELATGLPIPAAIPPLRRRLQLARLVAGLLDATPELAPRSSLYPLADSLANLVDEMQAEGVMPSTIANLDVSDHSAHWARAREFLTLVTPFFEDRAEPDVQMRQRLAVDQLAADWANTPPRDPVIVAGSTGSRGSTFALMLLVAKLPQGALVLPGFDADLPNHVWDAMSDAMTAEDHPQFRFRRLADSLGIAPSDIAPWTNDPPPAPDRNKLISLSLRPAPITDDWLREGPFLPDLICATEGITLIEAQSARQEAMALALVLRKAAEDGVTAALISPDRNLTRQVTAALDRWGILPDDSAGRPLALSAPGRLLRHIAGLRCTTITADQLLVLLKHPLTASGASRGDHLLLTRDLELKLRRYGPAFPGRTDLSAWAATSKLAQAAPWADWLGNCLDALADAPAATLTDHVEKTFALAEHIAAGPGGQPAGKMWQQEAGIAALTLMTDLRAEAAVGGSFSSSEFRDLLHALLSAGVVRDAVQPHPRIMIWGTLEARVQGAELVILGGLNDGIWPKLPEPDPWLNRKMRKDAGLLLPERQIGLAAHDYQQAVGAQRVILSRSQRDADAETVPSRWLNRLSNLMVGLPDSQGPKALQAMRDRGNYWLSQADALGRPLAEMKDDPRLQPATRPLPKPPVAARPGKLSLTNIARLIRDPYAIYARYILRLIPLDPLRPTPDPRERGNIFHLILARFVKERPLSETPDQAAERLLQIASAVLDSEAPFPAARILWLARFRRAIPQILRHDAQNKGVPLVVETAGAIDLPGLDFKLFGTPDRIDRLPSGKLLLIDYKSGTPPTAAQQKQYDKQLLLAAVMAEKGGFAELGPSEVERISYLGLGNTEKPVDTAIAQELLDEVWSKTLKLIGRYRERSTGYAARRAVFETRVEGDYDHLARFGEWQMSDRAVASVVGEPEEMP